MPRHRPRLDLLFTVVCSVPLLGQPNAENARDPARRRCHGRVFRSPAKDAPPVHDKPPQPSDPASRVRIRFLRNVTFCNVLFCLRNVFCHQTSVGLVASTTAPRTHTSWVRSLAPAPRASAILILFVPLTSGPHWSASRPSQRARAAASQHRRPTGQ